MGFQQFILAFMSAGLLFFALYYLLAILVIHKKIISKYLNFSIASIGASTYVFFELLSSLPFNDLQYLLFYKLKFISFLVFVPFLIIVSFQCFNPSGKKYIANVVFIMYLLFFLTVPFDIFSSLPINKFIINTPFSDFKYNIGKQNLSYRIFSIFTLIAFSVLLFQFILSKDKNKKYSYLIFIFGIVSSSHDFLVGANVITDVLTAVFCIYIVDAFIFYDFLLEDRKAYLTVLDLSKKLELEKREVTELSENLQKEKNESERRLRITEIYTRHSLVESIEQGQDPTKFQPNSIQIATLFTDIRDFTGISEGMKPLEVVDLLNSYFNRMNATIIKHNGEIDKLMGDCIMALFKNPDDALKSAIEMRYELARFNETAFSHRMTSINNGIGLNYGEVIIGNIGSESKMDYTVVGDIVNTASRLEALTKYYKVPLIISDDLKNQLNDNYKIRFIDEALVKGKSHPIKIYEVYDFEPPEVIEMKARNVTALSEAFEFYQQGEFLKAIALYSSDDLQSSDEFQDPVLPFYINRCKNLYAQQEAGLLKEWNGVFEFMDK